MGLKGFRPSASESTDASSQPTCGEMSDGALLTRHALHQKRACKAPVGAQHAAPALGNLGEAGLLRAIPPAAEGVGVKGRRFLHLDLEL